MPETRRINPNKITSAIQLFILLVVVLHVFNLVGPSTLDGTNQEKGKSSSKGSWQPKSKARFCDAGTTIEGSFYKSQSGEDKELMKYFNNLCEGTYMEMGALDGVRFSNTHVFHFGLQWKGVLVEASPRNFNLLTANRENEIATVHAGVCETSKPLHWVEGLDPATGGFYEFATPAFRNRWFSEANLQNAKVVECKPLADIVSETMGPRAFFDFFSLDIEGAEYSALASLDFDQVSFGMVIVESDAGQFSDERKNAAVLALMQSNGYYFMKEFERSYWFINRDFANIYSHLIYPEQA